MGQDYSDSLYKKSYAKDYVKSYKSGHVYIYEPPMQEKKQSKDSVLAEGRRRIPRPETRSLTKAPKVEIEKAEVKPAPVTEKKVESQIKAEILPQKTGMQKEEPTPLSDPESIFNKKEENINPKIFKYPVKHLHGTTYRDVFSGREINEDRARELLHTAGFTPKTNSGILPIFLSIVPLFFFGYFGLIPIMLTGFWLFKKDDTTYTKMTDMEKLSFSMPATKYEMMIYKFQAVICFIIAAVTFAARTIRA